MGKKTINTVRAHIFYTGRVQGVGFRYTAEGLATGLKLTGWVKNLADGRVEMMCEGSRAKIERLLSEILQSTLGPHIKHTDCSWEACKD